MKFKNPLTKRKFNRITINDVPDLLLDILLYAACFFPFVELVYIGSDTQPYGALAALFIVVIYVLRNIKISSKSYLVMALIGILVGASALVSLFQISIYMVFRSYYGYFSMIVIPLAVFWSMKKNGGMNDTLVKAGIWIWFLVGVIQKYVNPSFGYTLLSRHTTNATRGTVSLASEPSAYGYMCLFLILLAFGLKKYSKFYILLLLIQIVAFAGSTVTLVYLAAYVGFYMLNEVLLGKKFAMAKVVILSGGGIAALLMIRKFAAGMPRMHALVTYLFTDPAKLLKDGSIQMRMEDIVYSFQCFWQNRMMPHGLSEQKLMSGIGTLFYECGFIAIPLVVAVGAIIWKGYSKDIRLVCVLGFMTVMMSSIPFSSPMVCFYLGYCVYRGWERKQQKVSESLAVCDEPPVWYCGKLYKRKAETNI